MSRKIPNVHLNVEVPATFGRLAKRLGFEPRILIWHLAEDLLACPPKKLHIVKAHNRNREPRNFIPFPGREEVL